MIGPESRFGALSNRASSRNKRRRGYPLQHAVSPVRLLRLESRLTPRLPRPRTVAPDLAHRTTESSSLRG